MPWAPALVAVVREAGAPSPASRRLDLAAEQVPAILADAERHALLGVVVDLLNERGAPIGEDLSRRVRRAEVARELDHEAHVRLLTTIDERLQRDGRVAVALKGPVFAERHYPRPAARATSDLDLLVRSTDFEHVARSLVDLGYEMVGSAPARQALLWGHHHVAFQHAAAIPLELHFHAHRAFGRVLASDPLIDRRRAAPRGLRAIGVLAPEDELVYLAAHASSHQFVRLGWLFDLWKLAQTMSAGEVVEARLRAEREGLSRPLALAWTLLGRAFGWQGPSIDVGWIGASQAALAGRLLIEPRHPSAQLAQRLVYTTALCASPRAAARNLVESSIRLGLRGARRLGVSV